MSDTDPGEADRKVRAQYEAYPYPARDPRDEAKRLITGSPSHLDEIRHYVFAGRLDLGRPFRALVAGGGTGDAAIMLAQQLADAGAADAEVTHLDISSASRAIAMKRAEARGLTNIRFADGPIERVAEVAPGAYDYIDCCGVLHHLDSPEAGLTALVGVLKPAGGMGLMVYGTLGRTGVYPVQEALAQLAGGRGEAEKVGLAKRLVAGLPKAHWLKRNPFVGDHMTGGDAGLYDLLLHPRDRAYRVAEFATLVAAAGLVVRAWIEPARYDPDTYLSDPMLRKAAAGLPPLERAALAERLSGAMAKHIVYALPADRVDLQPPDPTADGAVLVLRDLDPSTVSKGLSGGVLKADLGGAPWQAPLPAVASAIIARLDGTRTVADIRAALKPGDPARFAEHVRATFAAFHAINRMLVREIR
ncbi:MAG: class I SAM-dependent methyltransferase [Thalassobaculaceae bacterium]|nr:class I SAM-dependent methyltransferase [Thalassobaculaceae bacterium]